ncbi:uncharacterized protein Z519_10001 [Cladophialophora bantiana CBS 173.52]|uniref:BZIP domain-containing protein n=1 Tax=Cladophialophora bantiana (strain ATCC 10958 / CBS 173.52 / CDC B-1940 / NIH 8579) TaxID=1442370 RepID=A0A0D2HX44_CLAB1|nr:uncharacterized protein Z519_10001 [Cladophialophora bantiana CBS 173.52]KIW89149.1 hypothetical protein Z519_10001 [Cladophialophora bantiana CBS 173.52]
MASEVVLPIQLATGPPPSSRKPKQISDKRRDKKRVADRHCQRQARARTKNKIAELESLVAHLTSQSGNEVCRELREQLETARTECRSLRRKLATIYSLAQINLDEDSEAARPDDATEKEGADFSPPFTLPGHPRSPVVVVDDPRVDASSEPGHQPRGPVCNVHGQAEFGFPLDDSLNLNFSDAMFDEQTFNPMGLGGAPLELDEMSGPHNNNTLNATATTPSPIPLSFPESGSSCTCSHHNTNTHPHKQMWNFVSDTLQNWKTHNWPRLRDDEVHDDIAVRAVIAGWDEPTLSNLSPSWRILRDVDQKVWANSRNVDRLAVICIMNLLLQCHLNPSEENMSRLPSWYQARPSQLAQKHAYAIDFFVWPGIRERFIYHYHKYCSNKFWALLAQHFRFVWPYDLRDCYVHNRQTGRYQLSDLFRRHLNDLTSFTFARDMFGNYPEFGSDIPKYMKIPTSLAPKQLVNQSQKRNYQQIPGSQKLIGFSPVPSAGAQGQWYQPPDEMSKSIGPVLWAPPLQSNQFF